MKAAATMMIVAVCFNIVVLLGSLSCDAMNCIGAEHVLKQLEVDFVVKKHFTASEYRDPLFPMEPPLRGTVAFG